MEPSPEKQRSFAIVITGASDGIGKSMAIEFAKGGARLGLIARREELLIALAVELRALGSPEVLVERVDVTNFAAQRAALERLENQFGGITHLILNAGTDDRSRPWEDSWVAVKHCLDLNLMAALNAAEWMKPRMVARRFGTIAGISSVAGTRGLPDTGAYSTSKAALSTYLETMRVDLAAYGVKTVVVAPGYVKTALTRKNRGGMPFAGEVGEVGRIIARGILKGRRVVIVPWPYKIAIVILRILPPGLFDYVIGKFMKRVRGDTPETRRASKT